MPSPSTVQSAAPALSDLELDALSDRMDTWSATDIVAWSVENFGSRLCVAASMADALVIDIAISVDPDI